MPAVTSTSFRTAALAMSLAALFSGCATQQGVSEQIAQLEQHLQAVTGAAREREAAVAKQIDALRSELKFLREALAQDSDRAARANQRLEEQAGRGAALERRMANFEDALDQVSGRARVTEAQVAIDRAAQGGHAGRQAEERAALMSRLSQAERRLDEVANGLGVALKRPSQDEIRLRGKVESKLLLTEDKTLYPLNSPELGGQDRAKLDALAARLKTLDKEYHLDIQGHTDNLGTDDYNYELGRARAAVVSRYLHEQAGIPLSRMSVISYGATSPLESGGASNRRIAILTLVLEK